MMIMIMMMMIISFVLFRRWLNFERSLPKAENGCLCMSVYAVCWPKRYSFIANRYLADRMQFRFVIPCSWNLQIKKIRLGKLGVVSPWSPTGVFSPLAPVCLFCVCVCVCVLFCVVLKSNCIQFKLWLNNCLHLLALSKIACARIFYYYGFIYYLLRVFIFLLMPGLRTQVDESGIALNLSRRCTAILTNALTSCSFAATLAFTFTARWSGSPWSWVASIFCIQIIIVSLVLPIWSLQLLNLLVLAIDVLDQLGMCNRESPEAGWDVSHGNSHVLTYILKPQESIVKASIGAIGRTWAPIWH